ncbi:MAG TPA: hypothetical protein VGJ06_11850 [Candidatus Acidoferrum sp.]
MTSILAENESRLEVSLLPGAKLSFFADAIKENFAGSASGSPVIRKLTLQSHTLRAASPLAFRMLSFS